jgi:hypothetical protein
MALLTACEAYPASLGHIQSLAIAGGTTGCCHGAFAIPHLINQHGGGDEIACLDALIFEFLERHGCPVGMQTASYNFGSFAGEFLQTGSFFSRQFHTQTSMSCATYQVPT